MLPKFADRLHNIHGLWDQMRLVCPEHVALHDPIHDGGVKLTYAEAAKRITLLAGGLQTLGVAKGDKIGLFAENSYRWCLIDGAVLKAGAANVVRGSQAGISKCLPNSTATRTASSLCLANFTHPGPGGRARLHPHEQRQQRLHRRQRSASQRARARERAIALAAELHFSCHKR